MLDAVCIMALAMIIIVLLAVGFLFWQAVFNFIMAYVKNPYIAIGILFLLFLIIAIL